MECALQVKSVLDPCEDENNDIADDEEESMAGCSGQEDESSSDGEARHPLRKTIFLSGKFYA